MFLVGAVLLLIFFIFLATIRSGKVGRSNDYTVAGRSATASSVGGIIMGALVGGASTVGTVQMAYEYGISAWWFTLGAGIGCLILGLFFARPLRDSGLVTIPEFLGRKYGPWAGSISMFTTSIGTFISVIAQFLAGIALFMSIFPVGTVGAVALFSALVFAFIYLGGLKSYGRVGKAKIVMLYVVMMTCTIMTFLAGYGPLKIVSLIPGKHFLSLWGMGMLKNMNDLVSMIVGVFCTQIYIQGIFAASDAGTARKGVLTAAFLMPPLGFMGVYIGLYLRATGVVIDPAQALPYFLTSTFNPFLAGLLWCGILITVIGTAAGLSLGMATNIVRDVFLEFFGKRHKTSDIKLILFSRISVIAVIVAAALAGLAADKSLILQWSYLSMGFRGVGTFFPLVFSIMFPGRLPHKWALGSMITGILVLTIWPWVGLGISPLFAGLGASALLVLVGILVSFKRVGGELAE